MIKNGKKQQRQKGKARAKREERQIMRKTFFSAAKAIFS
jgi:hypothetical protein